MGEISLKRLWWSMSIVRVLEVVKLMKIKPRRRWWQFFYDLTWSLSQLKYINMLKGNINTGRKFSSENRNEKVGNCELLLSFQNE
jgi:hypothetical protein